MSMTNDETKKESQTLGKRCPVCQKPSDKAHKPFCSARCADVDLHRWLSGRYVIPGKPLSPERDEE